jgi:hypothetical protein
VTTPQPGNPLQPLTRTQKILTGIVVGSVLTIATLGFIGSYSAVTRLAATKGFGRFAHAFPIAVDAGIIAFLALDLLLTWRRIAFPLLRYTAWALTAATIAFNAATAWPDKLGVGMHGTIPILFVIAVEAARHAIGRIADITADKHIEGPPVSRWILNPAGTFVLWRRQRLWGIRSWDKVVDLERERRIYRAQLRRQHGRGWRRKATADQILVLRLTADGMSVQAAIDRPHVEAQKQAEAEAKREAEAAAKAEAEAELKHRAELRQAEAEAKRRAEVAEAEAAAEVARLEVEAKQRAEAEAARILVAETEAKLAQIAQGRQDAEAEAELNRQRRAAEQARIQAEAARQARDKAAADAQAQREQEAREHAQRIVSQAAASGATSGSSEKPAGASSAASTSVSAITGPRAKKQAEVEVVLARMVEANDPEAVSLKWVQEHFGLKQTTAYDRLVTAQRLYEKTENQKSA